MKPKSNTVRTHSVTRSSSIPPKLTSFTELLKNKKRKTIELISIPFDTEHRYSYQRRTLKRSTVPRPCQFFEYKRHRTYTYTYRTSFNAASLYGLMELPVVGIAHVYYTVNFRPETLLIVGSPVIISYAREISTGYQYSCEHDPRTRSSTGITPVDRLTFRH